MSESVLGVAIAFMGVLAFVVSGLALFFNRIEEDDKRAECRAMGVFMFIIAAFVLVSCIPVFISAG
ncbi:MAG: hypothetical protein Q4B35_05080 [Slackia sp.]|nr:hypothetical protein [Slackia sp.]